MRAVLARGLTTILGTIAARIGESRAWAPGIAIAALALGACSKASEAPPPPPLQVSVASPLAMNIVDWDEYVGHFEAPQAVELRARITGVVTEIMFEDGQEVRAGQPLFTIDPRPYEAQLEQTRAQVAAAEAALANATTVAARSEQLVKNQAVSQEEYESNQAQLRTARANLLAARAASDNASLNLSFTTVRSPIEGRVSSRRVSLGDQVSAGTTLLTTVVSLDPIWFVFDGAESFYLKYLREAKQGLRGSSRTTQNPVDVQLSDETGFPHHGHMVFVDNAIDPGTGTIRAHATIANPDHFLTPGMFGRARLLGSGTYKALLIPDDSIVTDQATKEVYVVGQGGAIVKRNVEVGPEIRGLRVVRGGLAQTDLVVLDRLNQIQPGMKVSMRKTELTIGTNDTKTSPSVSLPQPSTATIPPADWASK
ncbi:efflux RND transporter periplasmic adaptor subunit [Pararobbsia alpina]|uniref:efflux RND transporter periplasmic adaptor subunit n=1 Tax=Pararobbsia alpina TaxID=621374 RepID=UPI0039A4D65F